MEIQQFKRINNEDTDDQENKKSLHFPVACRRR
jgi:hypothetical protein